MIFFLVRIYKIFRILVELEKIVGLPANLSAKACAAAEALAKAGMVKNSFLELPL